MTDSEIEKLKRHAGGLAYYQQFCETPYIFFHGKYGGPAYGNREVKVYGCNLDETTAPTFDNCKSVVVGTAILSEDTISWIRCATYHAREIAPLALAALDEITRLREDLIEMAQANQRLRRGITSSDGSPSAAPAPPAPSR